MTNRFHQDNGQPAVLDLQVLNEALGDDDTLVAAVLSAWIDCEPALSTELRSALADGDAHRAARTVHSLKSASLSIGALPFGSVCEAIEAEARTSGSIDGTRWLAALDAMLPATIEAVTQALDALRPPIADGAAGIPRGGLMPTAGLPRPSAAA